MSKICLIIVDMQNDFVNPKGSLYIKDSEKLIPIIEKLRTQVEWELVVLTQDWHPNAHVSFSTSHDKGCIGDVIDTPQGKQKLWPPHCIQNTWGSQIVPQLLKHTPYIIIQKGHHKNIDSYSGFNDHSGYYKTGLKDLLTPYQISDIYICGVATNYCVKFTAINSIEHGYITHVISNATTTISDDLEKDLKEIKTYGVSIVDFSL